MKRSLQIGVAIIIFVLVAFALFDRERGVVNKGSDGTTIVAFGDSLVEGVGASPGNDFPSILSRRLGEHVINEGLSGDTTGAALSRIDDVLAHDPKVVIVLLGGNDAIRKIPVNTTFLNLSRIIERIQASGSAVLLVGVQGGLIGDKYKNRFEVLADDMGAAYVPDILDGLIGNQKYMSDSIHPNNAGYEIIADKIEPILRNTF